MIDALLEGGANVNLPAHKGETPLMYAVLSRQRPAAKKLLEAGAEVNKPIYIFFMLKIFQHNRKKEL